MREAAVNRDFWSTQAVPEVETDVTTPAASKTPPQDKRYSPDQQIPTISHSCI
jgi:hypothetical protein